VDASAPPRTILDEWLDAWGPFLFCWRAQARGMWR
jgi:hypothetical protein